MYFCHDICHKCQANLTRGKLHHGEIGLPRRRGGGSKFDFVYRRAGDGQPRDVPRPKAARDAYVYVYARLFDARIPSRRRVYRVPRRAAPRIRFGGRLGGRRQRARSPSGSIPLALIPAPRTPPPAPPFSKKTDVTNLERRSIPRRTRHPGQ